MVRWQYKIVQQRTLPGHQGQELEDHSEREALLNRYGQDGWESRRRPAAGWRWHSVGGDCATTATYGRRPVDTCACCPRNRDNRVAELQSVAN
jgi:hypothetical protein